MQIVGRRNGTPSVVTSLILCLTIVGGMSRSVAAQEQVNQSTMITFGRALPKSLNVPVRPTVTVDHRTNSFRQSQGAVSSGGITGQACRFDAQCDDCNPCTLDVCGDRVCVGGNRNGFVCNVDYDCEGVCSGGINNGLLCRDDIECCGDGVTVADGVCSFNPCATLTTGGVEGTGGNQCVNALIPDYACDSGNREGQGCDPVVDPGDLTNGCPGTATDPNPGVCQRRFEPGAECDDGLLCNGRETCDNATGMCMPGQPDDAIVFNVFHCDSGARRGLKCDPTIDLSDPDKGCPPDFVGGFSGDCLGNVVTCEEAGLLCREDSQSCVAPCLEDAECNLDRLACTRDVCNPKLCVGGPTPDAPCRSDDTCGEGGTCTGGGDGSCYVESACGGGDCVSGANFICVGGGLDGKPCLTPADCFDGRNAGTCPTDLFTCLPGRCCVDGTCQERTFEQCEVVAGFFLGTGNACQPSNGGNLNTCPSFGGGIAPSDNLVVEVGPVIGPQVFACNTRLANLGDDYRIGDGTGFVEVTFVRFLISVQSAARLAFVFWDVDGSPVAETILPGTIGVSGPAIHTLDFDPPIVVPAQGFAGLSVAGNFTPGGSFSWLSIDDAVDVGANDPTRMLVNGVPTDVGSFNLGRCSGGARSGLWCNTVNGTIDCSGGVCDDIRDTLAFEIVANPTEDPSGACCMAETGACARELPWVCNAGGDTFQGVGTACRYCSNNFLAHCDVDADCPACVGGAADGVSCTNDAECPEGTCTGTSTCLRFPPGCVNTACCSPDGTCSVTIGGQCSNDLAPCIDDMDCTAGGTCEADCPPGAVGSGFASDCSPNACPQPVPTGGDNCAIVTTNLIHVPDPGRPPVTITISGNNALATFDDFVDGVCVAPTGDLVNSCDPDIGICANGSACSVSAQNCGDGTTCRTDDAQCAGSANAQCSRLCGDERHNPDGANPDLGWWESFHIDDCADIRIDFCTTEPILQPAYDFLQVGCPCGTTIKPSGTLEPIGPDGANERSRGFGHGAPFCAEDNFWQTFRALPPGTYYYPINSTFHGTFPFPSSGDYQLHITAGACRSAAPPPDSVCAVTDPGNCQEQDSAFAALIDRVNSTSGGVKVADDFIAGTPVIEQLCFKPAFFPVSADAGFFDCADPSGRFGPPADNFEIRFFTDRNGIPETLVQEQAPVTIAAKGWTGRAAVPQTAAWDYSIVFDPPLGPFLVGEKYWFEISGAGNENCLVGIGLSTDGNGFMLSEKNFVDPLSQVWTFEDRQDSGNDLAFCLGGPASPSIEVPQPVTGACCQCDGVCTDNVPWTECLGFTCLDNCPNGLPSGTEINPLFENGSFFPNQSCFEVHNGSGCLDKGQPRGCARGPLQELEDCELPLAVSDGSLTFNTTCSSTDGRANFPSGSACGSGNFVNDVWFEYIATCDGNVRFDLCGDSDFDMMFAVYSNGTSECPTECPPSLDTLVGGQCKDVVCPATADSPSFEFFGEPGVCYKIRVGGDDGRPSPAFGTARLSIDCECVPAVLCEVPEPVVLEQIADSSGNLVTNIKNRYLSFTGGTPGQHQAIRIRLIDMPAPYAAWTGADLWVGDPFKVSELSGKDDATPPTFLAAPLECGLSSAVFRDWSGLGMIHVFGEAIIPGATYEIRVFQDTCDGCPFTRFSDPVTVVNPQWGDVVGLIPTTGVWPAPDGTTTIAFDVVAVLDKFKNAPNAPKKSRADVQPAILDFKISIVDVTRVLDQFMPSQYVFNPSSASACP